MILHSPCIVNLFEMVVHYRIVSPDSKFEPDSYPIGVKSDVVEPAQYRGLDPLCYNKLVNPKDVTFFFSVYISMVPI